MDVHVGLELLQLLLVRHAEMLLLIDDQQFQVRELDALGQQGMGADDDVDLAVRQALLGFHGLLGRHHAGQLLDPDRQALEPLAEGAVMLPGQQSGRHDDRHLGAGHGGDEGGAQRHLGLAEPHVAANQPVHRAARRHVLQHVGDGAGLVFRLGEREAGAELVPGAFRGRQAGRLTHPAGGGGAYQLPGHIADALLHLRLARLPARAAQLVQCHAAALAAEAGQQFDVLDGQVKLLAAVVDQAQAVMRGRADAQGFQPVIAADAVFLVHDQVALRDLGRLGDELVGALAAAGRAADALAQQVLLAHKAGVAADEAAFQAQGDDGGDARRLLLRLGPGVAALDLEPVLPQQQRQAFA